MIRRLMYCILEPYGGTNGKSIVKPKCETLLTLELGNSKTSSLLFGYKSITHLRGSQSAWGRDRCTIYGSSVVNFLCNGMHAATWDHLKTAGLHVTNEEWCWDASFEAQENDERNIGSTGSVWMCLWRGLMVMTLISEFWLLNPQWSVPHLWSQTSTLNVFST